MNSGIYCSDKMNRETQIRRLKTPGKVWDVVVVGGGASGLGAALDAVSRGYETLLIEQYDFAKGTSGKSTKLVHGGVRYLAQGNFRLVREASIERAILLKIAPHLVSNKCFIIPVYSYFDLVKYTIGLKFYDWMAGGLSLGASSAISREKTLQLLPGVESRNLRGGVLYHDGQFDDARFALSLAQTINHMGGSAINYMKLVALQKNNQGNITGAELQDRETNEEIQISCKSVVNATGVFVDELLSMEREQTVHSISVSQGVHIVLDKFFLPTNNALMIPVTSDGRVLFIVPWHDKLIVGTTDTPVSHPVIEPRPLHQEIEFILETASSYLTRKPQLKDVLSVFAGLRPLVNAGNNGLKTKELSRSHKIISSGSGLFSMLGGKWTTYRKMGKDAIDNIEKASGWKSNASKTKNINLFGYIEILPKNSFLEVYGSEANQLSQQIEAEPEGWLSESLKIHRIQVEWAVKKEMARTIEDVLSRRTRALLLDAKEAMRIAPAVANIIANLLQKDSQWEADQLSEFSELAKAYLPEL